MRCFMSAPKTEPPPIIRMLSPAPVASDVRGPTPRPVEQRVHVGVGAVGAVVRRHHDARLLGETPEAIEDRIGGRPQAVRRDRRAVADGDDTSAVVEAPLELLDERVRVRRVQVRNSEDAVLVGEAPLVFDPAVERPAHLDRRLHVARQHRRLEHDALRREQPRGLDTLTVHDLQALVTLVPLGMHRRRFVERRRETPGGTTSPRSTP